jgi:hypothetical protein
MPTATRTASRIGVATALTLLAGRLAWGALAWNPGWTALTWDDFTRAALAQRWAAEPFFTPDLVWLPLPFWINGLVFRVVGTGFRSDPLALIAIINTVAIVLTALLVGWAAWRAFRSVAGGLIAYTAILFSPWGFFTSLSGLAEPLYYLAIASVVTCFVWWKDTGRIRAVVAGSAALFLASAMRYEGWWLAAAWATVIAGPDLLRWWRGRPDRKLTASLPLLGVTLIPFAAPAGWMVVNLVRTGNPLFFATESARYFLSAYGNDLFDSVGERLTYYPLSLIRSAPLLLVVIAWAAWQHRAHPTVRGLIAVVAVSFALFFGSSLISPAVGAFNERFMFAFVVALAPLLGGIPAGLSTVDSSTRRRAVIAAGLVVTVAVTWYRVVDRPIEWTHAPDLLALGSALGEVATPSGPLLVATGSGMTIDQMPLSVQNGTDVQVTALPDPSPPGEIPPSVDVVVERLPSRIAEISAAPGRVIGRYYLYGPAAASVPAGSATCSCPGWVFSGEDGSIRPLEDGPFLGLEFVSDDPPPGAEASLNREVAREQDPLDGSIELRWLYGHGFNAGRINVEVRVDGETIFTRDVASPSRWVRVPFTIPAGTGTALVEVVVVAQPGIEQGWGWGRASTVLVRVVDIGSS